tara:strand:- start:502 stop:1548 length:1047 start_codon:yes stop_codon:yes gene_type:complete
MSDKDILEVAKNILESEKTLDEAPEMSAPEAEVKPKKKGATDVDAEGETPAEAPSVNTDSLSDEGNYSTGPDGGGGAEVPAPEASDGDSEKNKKGTDMKPSSAKATAEHMDALFGGEDLSEDFRNKATTIFEAALSEREEILRTEIQESFDVALAEETQRITTELSEKLDDYLNYVIKEWVEDNEIAIEHGLKNEISESFIADLKNLFENHNIEVPEEKFDALAEANEKIEVLENKLNEQLEANVSLTKSNSNLECVKVFAEMTSDLTDTDTEKLRSLAEGIEYDSTEQYTEKLSVLKNSYFNQPIAETNDTEENTLAEEAPVYGGQINDYVNSISRLSDVPRAGKSA